MTENNERLIVNHLRLAVRTAVVLLPVQFFYGVCAGLLLCQWHRTPWGAAGGAIILVITSIWTTVVYYRTRGLAARPEATPGIDHTPDPSSKSK